MAQVWLSWFWQFHPELVKGFPWKERLGENTTLSFQSKVLLIHVATIEPLNWDAVHYIATETPLPALPISKNFVTNPEFKVYVWFNSILVLPLSILSTQCLGSCEKRWSTEHVWLLCQSCYTLHTTRGHREPESSHHSSTCSTYCTKNDWWWHGTLPKTRRSKEEGPREIQFSV